MVIRKKYHKNERFKYILQRYFYFLLSNDLYDLTQAVTLQVC